MSRIAEQGSDGEAKPLAGMTSFRRDLLHVIDTLDLPNGRDIWREIEPEYPDDVGTPRVYQNLSYLEERDLIEKGIVDARENHYRLTDSAKERLEADREWRMTE